MKPTNDQPTTQWKADVEDIVNHSFSQKIFDAVVVASGRYDKPNIPDIPGLDEWSAAYPKDTFHSKAYHDAALYKDKVFSASVTKLVLY